MAAAPLSIITNDFFYLFISLLHNHSHALSFLRNTDIFGRLLSIHSMENDKEKTRKRQLKENKGIKVNTVCNTKGKGKQKKKTVAEREKYPKSQPVDCAAATNMALTPVAYSWIPSSFFADHRPDPSQFFLPLVAVALFGRLMGRQYRTGPLTSTTQTSSCSMCTNRIFREKHCVHSGNT